MEILSIFRNLNIGLICLLVSTAFYSYVKLYILSASQKNNSLHEEEKKKSVLVTGGAGFIGFHVAFDLVERGSQVVVLDNFNDYYNVTLKIDRAYQLHKLGVHVYAEDLCEANFLEEIFLRYKFTHVVHMAAQAGVRYSLENPLAYVKSNIECHLAILEVLKEFQDVKLVYASSSSVYGKEADIPFQLSANTDHPGNMYAATKKTDELLSLHYCKNHHIMSVALRFFTVYGPWGRPDMSVYRFTDAIISGRKVPMFHASDDNPLSRDFTYIDDVVSGILSAMDYIPEKCGEKFNLGCGNPISVPHMVNILEKEIGIKADVARLPLPPTEILKTWADIATSTEKLGFRPSTNLTIGIKRFMKWYKEYTEQKQNEMLFNKHSEAEIWFAGLFEDKLNRHARYQQNKMITDYDRTSRRFRHKENIHTFPLNLAKKFKVFHDVVSLGNDLLHYGQYNGDIQTLQHLCESHISCVGFTSDGTLKSHLNPIDHWQSKKNVQMHIVEMKDWCSSDAHTCHKHSQCVQKESVLYRCSCDIGYIGDGFSCLAQYGQVKEKHVCEEFMVEYKSVFSITQMKAGQHLVFFEGLESVGGDYMVVPGSADNISALEQICRTHPICIAFTSDGRLKRKVSDPNIWEPVEESKSKGIYIFDINYCPMDDIPCPENSECKKTDIGKYMCVCAYDYIMIHGECVKVPIDRSLVPSIAKCTDYMC